MPVRVSVQSCLVHKACSLPPAETETLKRSGSTYIERSANRGTGQYCRREERGPRKMMNISSVTGFCVLLSWANINSNRLCSSAFVVPTAPTPTVEWFRPNVLSRNSRRASLRTTGSVHSPRPPSTGSRFAGTVERAAANVERDGIDLDAAMANARANLAEGKSPGAGLDSAFDQADAAFADLIVTSVDDQGVTLDDQVSTSVLFTIGRLPDPTRPQNINIPLSCCCTWYVPDVYHMIRVSYSYSLRVESGSCSSRAVTIIRTV